MMEALACHPLGTNIQYLFQSPRLLIHMEKTQSKFECSSLDELDCEGYSSLQYLLSSTTKSSLGQAQRLTFIRMGAEIIKRETPLGLYKGLGAVITGIVPKMAIRFTSFEWYKSLAANTTTGVVSGQGIFVGK